MIQTYNIETSMGKLTKRISLPFLSDAELAELNTIGYTGRNSKGSLVSRQEFLNSLGKGEFEVRQTEYDNGDFTEGFAIVRVINTPEEKKNSWQNCIDSLTSIKNSILEIEKQFGRDSLPDMYKDVDASIKELDKTIEDFKNRRDKK